MNVKRCCQGWGTKRHEVTIPVSRHVTDEYYGLNETTTLDPVVPNKSYDLKLLIIGYERLDEIACLKS